MKKMMVWILALIMMITMAACGNAPQTAVDVTEKPVVTEETEPAETEPAETEPAETAPTETEPAETEPEETKPEETEPVETEPAETEPEETKPEETKPEETEPVETEPAETEPAETEPAETEPVETTPAETKPTTGAHVHDYNFRIDKKYTYCTEGGAVYHYCECGSWMYFWHPAQEHALRKHEVEKATHDKEGLANVSCAWCPYTDTAVIPKVDVPYFIGFEIISVNRPNAHYLSNGQDLLTRLYGKNQAFQLGDSIVVKVIMSDGGSNFKLDYSHDCIVTQEGNLLYIQFETEYPAFERQASFTIKSNDWDNEPILDGMIFDLVCQRENLGQGTFCASELRKYGVRLGMKWVTNGTDFLDKYNGGYTWNDESKSLTGCTIRGTDDLIPIPGNPDWIEEAIALLDQYKKMGFTVFSISTAYHFTTLAE